MNCAECTYPPRDWKPVDLSAGDTDQASIGFMPRALRADSAGTIVARFTDTPAGDPDRVLQVRAGEVICGFVTIIRAQSSAKLHVAK